MWLNRPQAWAALAHEHCCTKLHRANDTEAHRRGLVALGPASTSLSITSEASELDSRLDRFAEVLAQVLGTRQLPSRSTGLELNSRKLFSSRQGVPEMLPAQSEY